MYNKTIEKAADNIRILAASMVEKAGSGHPGGAMGGADFVNILYSEFLNWDPDDMSWPNRDRFFLDPGHMSPMLYSILTLTGNFTLEEIENFRQWGSPTPGHPELNVNRGIENTSGPLGQGHAMAIGAAIAEKFLSSRFGDWMSHKIYTFISDGGIQEEISQGAGRIAGTLGLNNLIMFYDSNDIQLSHETHVATAEDTAKKYEAWGWNVLTIEGNNAEDIRNALKKATEEKERPTLIIGKTIMGKGALDAEGKMYERKVSTHGMPLSKAGGSIENTVKNLGGDPANPFAVFPEVKEYYEKVLDEKRKLAKAKKDKEAEWASKNPELVAKFRQFFSNAIPEFNLTDIEYKANSSTRNASGSVLGYLARHVENIIVASADLSNSDKTDGFLKQTKPLVKGDFSGSFLQAGVAELTMAAICNGIALHGGIIVACGTFFVFSDYMKPAVRLSALMELPVKFIWSHDAFRVGEDGPTHQPVEQEAQIRLLEQLKNHSGKNSVLVLRPADSPETLAAWKTALENIETPTALILSRQDIADVPAVNNNRLEECLQITKGAYIVQRCEGTPDVILLANGSEVSTLIDGAKLLQERDQLNVQVVSAPSEGLFMGQPQSYKDKVIPPGIPVVGLTAGLPSTLSRLAGLKGKVIGLEHFGYSAPYKVLDEKFGYTAENVYNVTKEHLKNNK